MIEQGSQEWLELRAGKVTASRVADVIAKTKTGYSTSRANYMTQLCLERFGVMPDTFTNSAMQHGTETEPFARAEYEIRNNVAVAQVAFVQHPTIAMAGMSPDGIVDTGGLLEIKCPNTTTHFEYLLSDEIPQKYKTQMAWQMACTGSKWCDFVSFDDRAPEGLHYLEIRYERDDVYISSLEKEVIQFLKEVDDKFNELNNKLTQIKLKEVA